MMLSIIEPGLLPLTLIVPLGWGILSLMVVSRLQVPLALFGFALQLLVACLLWLQVSAQGALVYALGAWPAPLGIGLRADGLAATLVVVSAILVAAIGYYACVYFRHETAPQRFFWPLLWFLSAGLNSVWLAQDLFNLYVCLELVTLISVGLAALSGQPAALAASLRYLLIALLGSLAYLLGVALVYGAYGTLAVADLAILMTDGATSQVALGLMVGGLAIKAALFPLHGWLPPAHGGALTPVSALLSALVVKTGFYIMARLCLETAHAAFTGLLAQLLGVLGACAVLWGGLLALQQRRLKMLVAYSTVAQIGYLFLLFPLVADELAQPAAQALGWHGAMLQLIGHAFAKAALFLVAGNLILTMGQDDLGRLVGLSRFRPLPLMIFGLASITLMGLPPSAGFNAKWMMMQSAWLSGQWQWIVVLALGGLLSAAYLLRVFLVASREDDDAPDTYQPLPGSLNMVALALAAIALLLGLGSAYPLAVLSIGSPFPLASEGSGL